MGLSSCGLPDLCLVLAPASGLRQPLCFVCWCSTWLLPGPSSARKLVFPATLGCCLPASLIPSGPVRAGSQVQFCRASVVRSSSTAISMLPLELSSAGDLGAGSSPRMGPLPHPWPSHRLEARLCSGSTRALPLHVTRSSACWPLRPLPEPPSASRPPAAWRGVGPDVGRTGES